MSEQWPAQRIVRWGIFLTASDLACREWVEKALAAIDWHRMTAGWLQQWRNGTGRFEAMAGEFNIAIRRYSTSKGPKTLIRKIFVTSEWVVLWITRAWRDDSWGHSITASAPARRRCFIVETLKAMAWSGDIEATFTKLCCERSTL